jgi:hypothetical protein
MSQVTHHRSTSWGARLLMLAVILLVFCSCVYSQAVPRPSASPPSDPTSNNPAKDESDTNFGSPEAEMRAKQALKEEKKHYDEHLGRAREVSQIATQLLKTYEARKAFNSDDAKKLERLEKLTKRIRNDAGGSDSETDADIKEIPTETQMVVKRVAELADELREMVEKTPRNVVSAAVIDQANKLLGFVQHLRDIRR